MSKSNTLRSPLKPNQTPEAARAEMMVHGVATNVVTAVGYSKTLGDVDATEAMAALIAEIQRVQGGDMTSAEGMLAAQAVTLNAMFTQLAHTASKMTIVDQIDRFVRLALKAQGQCRATLETLALIKNPPVFARQANIAHGPQQVNNTAGGVPVADPSRTEHHESGTTKLVEPHGERLDFGATRTTGHRDPAMAAVGTIKRPAHA